MTARALPCTRAWAPARLVDEGHAAYRGIRGPGSHRIAVIAARETGERALFVVPLALGLRGVLGQEPQGRYATSRPIHLRRKIR
jgi:hypothetical protein